MIKEHFKAFIFGAILGGITVLIYEVIGYLLK